MDGFPIQSDGGDAADAVTNRNYVAVGAPGVGKTTCEIKEIVAEADRGDTALVIIDPHKDSLARGVFAHLCERGHRDRILYDYLPAVDRVLKWDFLPPSRARCPRVRQGENQTRCEQFAEILLRRRGKESAATMPAIEEWLLAALSLLIHQARRRPLSDLRYAFSFQHRTFLELLEGCTDEDTRYKFQGIVASRQTPYKAAERVIMAVCRSAAFQVRSEHGGGFRYNQHLDNYGIVIVEGGEGGTLSADAMRTMMGAVIMKTFNYVREREHAFPRVTLSMDEANNADLIGEAGHEVRAMAELRKKGLGVRVLVQHLDFASPRIERAVFATSATHRHFHISDPRTALRCGEDLGGTFETPGTKTRHYKDGSSWDAPATFNNPYANELRNLSRGECYTRRGNQVLRERIIPLPNAFGLSKPTLSHLVSSLLKIVQQRPEYYSPGDGKDGQPQSPTPPPPQTNGDGPFAI